MSRDPPTRIRVVALGGTIAMTGDEDQGVRPTLTGQALVGAVPSLAEVASIDVETFRQVPGAHLRLEDVVDLAAHLSTVEADGFVITQGTDTIEETAFALDLLWDHDTPAVVTGAMRNPSQPGADGAANLLNAVRIAASSGARTQGVIVTLDDQIHAARFVRKGHASKPSAFVSASAGPVGWIAEDRVRLPFEPRSRVNVPPPHMQPLPRVGLLRIGMGDDGALLGQVAAAELDGIVIEGMGVGHLPSWLVEPVTDLVERLPVMLASRTGAGENFERTYGFVGSERDLLERGLVGAGPLDGLKARILLTFALAAGWSTPQIADFVRELAG